MPEEPSGWPVEDDEYLFFVEFLDECCLPESPAGVWQWSG
jgi:hypothetical protein